MHLLAIPSDNAFFPFLSPLLLHFMKHISPFVFLSLFKEGWGGTSIWKKTEGEGRCVVIDADMPSL